MKYDDLGNGTVMRGIYKRLLASIERRVVHAVCGSAYAASRLKTVLPGAIVSIVYPGARNPPLHLDRSREEGFCYYYSRFHPQKNQDFLLDVFEKLPFDLYLAGGTWDRPFRAYHSRVLERAGRMSNVRVLTNVSQSTLFDLLARSSLFLFPAKKEPFGMILLEAMSMEKPIIALDSGACREVLGGAGILCNNNVEDWRAAITEALSNPELRLSLSRRGLTRAAEFSWDKTAKGLIRILENA